MIEAFERKIIFPNKSKTKFDNYYDGHLIESETYVGGHVEALQTGVYRKDIPIKFKVDRETIKSVRNRSEGPT
jgi:DNA polymerase epsilon subunit 1